MQLLYCKCYNSSLRLLPAKMFHRNIVGSILLVSRVLCLSIVPLATHLNQQFFCLWEVSLDPTPRSYVGIASTGKGLICAKLP